MEAFALHDGFRAGLLSDPENVLRPKVASGLDIFATLYRHILQKCCTCRNNPHHGTRTCLVPVAGPKGHSACLQDCSCIGTGCCRTFLARSLCRFFLTSRSSSFATVEIVFLRCGPNSDERRRCSGISLRASVLCRFWCTTPFSA